MLQDCQQLFESIPESIIVLDNDGYIKDLNPAAELLTGYTREELINQPLHKLYSAEAERVRSDYELGQAKAKGKHIAEGWKLRKDGSQFWAEMTLATIYD